ncbi:MAG: serine/threonine protein kinase [Candidatus Rokuibacteriota bacterium]|nr:MAG: serine/threonine protein kinase [Candidatus Rokubacteria bacterium]
MHGVVSLRGSAYGLQIESNSSIPGLALSTTLAPVPDLQVFLGILPDWLNAAEAQEIRPWRAGADEGEAGQPGLRVWALAGGRFHRLLYPDGTEFIVDEHGTSIWSWWPDGLSLEDTATYLLGPVMGFVLLRRGVICLHASAIAVGERAIAIVGPPEAGKSTTAAVFAGQAYPVLSDDVVTLDERHGLFLVHPAYPRIRLWPESVAALYGSPDALPRLTPTWDKRYLALAEPGYKFQQASLPLAAIYLLDERGSETVAPRIAGIRGRAALMSLLGNGYATRWMDRPMRAREFELLGRVVASVPVRRAVPHAEVANLPRLCDMILEDVQALAQSAERPTQD